MGIDWSNIPPGVVLLFVTSLIANAVAGAGLYYGLTSSIRDLKYAQEKATLVASQALDNKSVQIRADINQTIYGLRGQLVEDVTRLDKDIREASNRLKALETGSDEWSRTLRARSHKLANQVNKLKLKIILLVRDMPNGDKAYTGSDLDVHTDESLND